MSSVVLSASFDYLCYGSEGHYKYVTLLARGPTIDIRIWRLKLIPALKGLTLFPLSYRYFFTDLKSRQNIVESLRVGGEETWRPEWASNPRSPSFQHCTRALPKILSRRTRESVLVLYSTPDQWNSGAACDKSSQSTPSFSCYLN